MIRHVCLFDVNGTLLDLAALDGVFREQLGDAAARREWFAQLLQLALASAAINVYTDFGALGRAALLMTAERRGVSLSSGGERAILSKVREMPAYPDVPEGLQRLKDADYRLAALTNSPATTAEAGLAHAGIRGDFEQVCSVDAVQRFKPAAEPYRMAAERLGVATSGVRMIAAHDWDLAGASAAGCATAFIARPGQVLNPLAKPPEVQGPDLIAVAREIIARDC